MRAGVIAPVVLPASGRATAPSVAALVRGPLPLPTLTPGRMSTVVYGLSALDDRGCVTDRVVMRALGWCAGLRAVLRWPMPAGSAVAVLRLDGARKFSESCGKPVSRIDIHAEFVVASTEVLDEGMSRANDSC